VEIVNDTDHLLRLDLITHLDTVKLLRHPVEDEAALCALGILLTEVAPLDDRDANDFRERG